jgi:hypothetical protein
MDEETEVVVAPEATEEEVAPEATEEVEAAAEEEQIDWEARAKKNEELANNYKVRAEKAEKKAKEIVPSENHISQTDSITLAAAIAKGTVEEDDLDRVQKFAKDEGVSIKEALKSDELKAILALRVEKRATAQAANVSNVRRGPSKASDEVLVSNASKGRLPDSDDEIDRLMAAKAKRK